MQFLKLPQERKQQYLLLSLGVLLVGGAGLAWYTFFGEGYLPQLQTQPPPPRAVDIDFSVFEHPVFQVLGEPRPPILFPEEVGKRNPFLPL